MTVPLFEGNAGVEDGYEFHVKGKHAIMEWLFCNGGFRALSALTVRPLWLEQFDKYPCINAAWFLDMQKAFMHDNKRVLKHMRLIDRKIVETASKWLIVLFRNDSMYRARIGWIVIWLMDNGDPADPVGTLKRLNVEYFNNEHRKDRILQLHALFDEVVRMVEQHPESFGIFVSWAIRYIQQNRATFTTEPVPGRSDDPGMYNPDNWFGGKNKIGAAWAAVHGDQA